jgi:hypothetical protein
MDSTQLGMQIILAQVLVAMKRSASLAQPNEAAGAAAVHKKLLVLLAAAGPTASPTAIRSISAAF